MDRLRPLGKRWPWFNTVLDVQQRFGELNGGPVASAVTLSAFLSLFPLILVAVGVAGFFASNSTDLAGNIISNLGLTGDAADTMRSALDTAVESRRAASVVGLAGLLWAGLGLVAALQYAVDTAWQVTGRGLKDKLFALLWLGGATLLFVASFVLSTLLNFLPGLLAPVNIVVALAVNMALFLWTFRVLGHRDVGWRPLIPGAILAGVGFEALKAFGAIWVPRMVASSSALYGSIGAVFAVLGWLFFFGRLLVYSSVVNVVLWEQDQGTVTVDLEAPKLPGQVSVEATRAGAVTDPDPVAVA